MVQQIIPSGASVDTDLDNIRDLISEPYVNSALGPFYSVPFADGSVPELVKAAAATVTTAYFLDAKWGQRGAGTSSSQGKALKDWADDMLKKMQEGRVKLYLADGTEVTRTNPLMSTTGAEDDYPKTKVQVFLMVLVAKHDPADRGLKLRESYEEVFRNLDKTVLPKLKRFKLKKSVPRLFKDQGLGGPGTRKWVSNSPGGPGTRKWVSNSPWVARVKGFNKPLISGRGRGGSKLIEGMTVYWRSRGKRSGKVVYDVHLLNEKPYAAYLQEGYRAFRLTTKKARGRAGSADYLKIPFGPGQFIFRDTVLVGRHRGGMPGRKFIVWLNRDRDEAQGMVEDQIGSAVRAS
jgi:hypothetical protein